MTIPASGQVRFSDLRSELAQLSGQLRIGERSTRAIQGVLAGQIKLSGFRSKTRQYTTFNMTGAAWETANTWYRGFGMASAEFGSNGSINPWSFQGLQVSLLIVNRTKDGAAQNVQITLNKLAYDDKVNKILAITIGGIRIPVTISWDYVKYNGVAMSGKQNVAIYAAGALTLAQYNTIVTAIVNKTSSVTIEYF